MISRQNAQTKFSAYHEAQGSHDEVYTDGSKMQEIGLDWICLTTTHVLQDILAVLHK